MGGDVNKPLYEMLNLFQEGKSHVAVVVDIKDHRTYRGEGQGRDGKGVSDSSPSARGAVLVVKQSNFLCQPFVI